MAGARWRKCVIPSYADDFVCAFRYKEDAQRFYQVLPKRLGKFSLEVAPEKTQLLRFSRFHQSMHRRFTFLGFELYWFNDRNGIARVMRRNARLLYRFYQWSIECVFKWLNRRGGKRRSFTWASFAQALKRAGVAVPRITERSDSMWCLHKGFSFDANVSTTEEPDAGKPHVRVCAGGAR